MFVFKKDFIKRLYKKSMLSPALWTAAWWMKSIGVRTRFSRILSFEDVDILLRNDPSNKPIELCVCENLGCWSHINIDIIHVVAGNGQVLQIDPFVTVLVLAFLRLCLVNVWRNLEQNENLNETKLPNYTLPLNVYIPTVVPRVAASSRRGGYQSVQKSIRGHISLSGSCIVFSVCCHRHFFVTSIWILLGILFQCCGCV